jgi:hypothetical protein
MLPFVAVSGPGFNDARFGLVLGAGNAGLVYLLVRRLARPGLGRPGVPLGRVHAGAVAAVFAFGTVHAYAAPIGRVWFTAHVVTVGGLLLYLLECAGPGRPLVAGGALALAVLTRPTVLPGGLFWLLLARRGARPGRRRSRLVRFALPLLAGGAALLLLNAARFGSPLDFGYAGMRVSPVLAPDLRAYGQFHPHFLARNLGALLTAPPAIDGPGLVAWLRATRSLLQAARRLATPGAWRALVRFDPWGTGLWAVSPVLLIALRRPRREDVPLAAAAGLSALAVALPDLLYYNTGWVQYGYRFALDFLPFLLILVALGLRRPTGPVRWGVFGLLLLVSAVSNLVGLRWFLRLPPF